MDLQVKHHTTSDQFWIDEKGIEIPRDRVSKTERLKERHAKTLLNGALKINSQLIDFKAKIDRLCQEAFDSYMKEKNVTADKLKGNHTWFNFDRSIKIEVTVNDRITFDDHGITACKAKLHLFLSNNVAADESIKKMVMDVFETSNGSLDSKKVMGLFKYESIIDNENFKQAMTLLRDAIRKPDSKTYFRVWAKGHEGQYVNIDLNFSSVKIK